MFSGLDGRQARPALNVARSEIPAVTHLDYSARVQTVHRDTNPRYHALISAFAGLTGCPVLVNTSFNVRGEPIVCTPEDAFRCFMGTELDVLRRYCRFHLFPPASRSARSHRNGPLHKANP